MNVQKKTKTFIIRRLNGSFDGILLEYSCGHDFKLCSYMDENDCFGYVLHFNSNVYYLLSTISLHKMCFERKKSNNATFY